MAKNRIKNHSFGFSDSVSVPGKQNGARVGVYTYSKEMPRKRDRQVADSNGRITVDDATWDKAMMEVMQEYDEAWTQLADK